VANGAAVSASSTGTLVYRTGFATRSTTSSDGERLRIQVDVTEAVDKQFTWFDRSGKELERLGAPTPVDSGSPALSPDGKTVAFARTVEGNTDIWLLDLEKETYSRFTSDPARDNFPYWAPDGRNLVFSSNRNGTFQILRKPVAGGAEVLLSPLPNVIAKDSLADGRLLVQQTASRVAVLHPNGTLTHVANNIPLGSFIQPQVSPDTRWIAYQSNRSGNDEVYVAPFPLPANYLSLKPVSSKGGAWPIWARNGRELFYIAPDGALMAVPFNLSSGAGGNAVRLFVPPMLSSVRQTSYLTQYAVSTEGRFLVIGVQEVESPIQVIRNWKP
jgi:Tol biopolymer transport system component